MKKVPKNKTKAITAELIAARLIAAVAFMFLIGGPAALAQQTGGGTGSMGTGNQAAPSREAPIGHRQPRADQVPSEKNLSDPNNPANKEDQALDRKIKSICRGC
jgi:hypothetical protein